ncbi:YciI family protein [Mesorhizobium sp. M1328]|uniref:YciI family protein n=1 Tax=Mesorhizobium sp. M1328 TaxID=2957082 RepID=UPI003334D532
MKAAYVFLWTLTGTQEQFDELIPDLINWLKKLEEDDHLLACGSWKDSSGGLTLINADDLETARKLHQGNPLNPIGNVVEYEWDVYYANLSTSADFKLI